MKWQQFVPDLSIPVATRALAQINQFTYKRGDLRNFLFCVIDRRYNRRAKDDCLSARCQSACIRKNAIVRLTCRTLVFALVEMLDVHHDQVSEREQRFKRRPRDFATRLDGSVQAMNLALLEDLQRKILAQCRLASREGDPAAGRLVEWFVRENLRHHLIKRHCPSFHLEGAGKARFDAESAQLTVFAEKDMRPVIHFMGMIGTGEHALAAGDASFREVAEFRFRVLTFGIVAPEAIHGASLQEHGRAYARTVVQGEALNIKNNLSSVHDDTVRKVDHNSCN